jgi:hypothetical protein
MKSSDDGGKTWSDSLDLPANWLEIGRGCPTIHRLVDANGKARLFVVCRYEKRTPFLQAVSEDDGATRSRLRPIGLAQPEGGPIIGWSTPITILEATAPDGRDFHAQPSLANCPANGRGPVMRSPWPASVHGRGVRLFRVPYVSLSLSAKRLSQS